MLCSECYKEINQGKEIQVKGTIFCENCVKKDDELIKKEIVAICRKCCKPICNNKKNYEVSVCWNIDGGSKSTNLIMCHLCYRKWLVKTQKENKIFIWSSKLIGRNWKSFFFG